MAVLIGLQSDVSGSDSGIRTVVRSGLRVVGLTVEEIWRRRSTSSAGLHHDPENNKGSILYHMQPNSMISAAQNTEFTSDTFADNNCCRQLSIIRTLDQVDIISLLRAALDH